MNILWNPNEAVDILEMPLPLITEGTQDMGDGVYWLKAGTPLDEYFAVANDGDAKYVVAEDFYFISTKPEQAKVVQLITAGYVDINKAEAASGITYSQDCIDALMDAGIVLVDGTLPSSGGGGGGGLPPYENEDINKVLTLADSGEAETETLVAIEEQTVTTNTGGTAKLTVNRAYWAPGRTVHLTVNGSNYDCVIDSANSIQAVVDGHEVKISGSPLSNFSGFGRRTYTVSATIEVPVPIPAPAWETHAPFIINISEEIVDGEQVFVADKKPSEATAALMSGRAIYVNSGKGLLPASGMMVNPNGIVSTIGVQNITVDSTDGVYLGEIMLSSSLTADKYLVTHSGQSYPATTSGT